MAHIEMTPEEEMEGIQLLLEAVVGNNTEEVRAVLSSGIDPSREFGEKNAICLAASRGYVDIVRILLDAGVSGGQTDSSDKMWYTQPIHKAAAEGHLEVVKLLLVHGMDINTTDKESRTALHWAATRGQLPVVQYLVESGSSVNLAQADGFTSLHAATCLGHLETCRYLLSVGAEVNRADTDGWSALHAAACYNHYDLVELFLSEGAIIHQEARDGFTPLHMAVEAGRTAIVEKLALFPGAPLEAKTAQGNTPFFESVWRNRYPEARFLVDMYVNLNTRNVSDLSPLCVAVIRVKDNFIRLLIEAGVDLQKEGWLRDGELPISWADFREDYAWMQELVKHPCSLQSLCCVQIRRCLNKPLSRHVDQLNIPGKLRDMIALVHL